MGRVVYGIVLLSVFFSWLQGGDLLERYKQKLNGAPVSQQTAVSQQKPIQKTLSNALETIQKMKKNTFESTDDFKKRRLLAIEKLENEMHFYFTNASEEYSAGTVQMQHYDPDTEIIKVRLNWHQSLFSFFSQKNLIKSTSFRIAREKAKNLFAENRKQFFHIKFIYLDDKPIVSEILLYNQYVLYTSVHAKSTSENQKTTVEKFDSVKYKQNPDKKNTALPVEPKDIQAEHELRKIFNSEYDLNSSGRILLILILIIFIISIIVLTIKSSKNNKTNSDSSHTAPVSTQSKQKKTKSEAVKKSTVVKKSVGMSKNINYSKRLHEISHMKKIHFVYKKTKLSKEKVQVEILQNKKVITQATANTYKEAKQMAAYQVLSKINS